MKHFITILTIICVLFVLISCAGDTGLSTGVKIADYAVSRVLLSTRGGLSSEDLNDLQAGKLSKIRKKFEAIPAEKLTFIQLKLLCDLYSKFNDFNSVVRCLDRMEKMSKDDSTSESIAGRRSLIYLQTGRINEAATLSEKLTSDGGKYIHALANAALGNVTDAQKTALKFSHYKNPKNLYFSTAIYMALGEYPAALNVLTHPRYRLLKDYGYMPYTNKMGQVIHPAIFRLDLFDEFNLGLVQAVSFAPKANVYIEFMAAKAFTYTGDEDEGRKRFSYVIDNVGAGAFRDILWMSYYERGRIFEKQGDSDKAVSDYNNAIELIEGIRSTISNETGRVGFAGDKFNVYNRFVSLLISRGENQAALEIVERSKGRAFVDMLNSRATFSTDPSEQVGGSLLEDFSEAEANVLNSSGDLSKQELDVRLKKLAHTRSLLEDQAPLLASLVITPAKPFSELVKPITKDEAVLIFHQVDNTLYTFMLMDGHLSVVSSKMDKIILEIKQFRDKIENSAVSGVRGLSFKTKDGTYLKSNVSFDQNGYRYHAKSLFEKLILPVSGVLKKRRITIIPTTELYYLPFSALMDQNDQYIIKYSAIRILPNLSIIPLLSNSVVPQNNYLVFGNPDRGDSRFNLPGSEIEAVTIAGNISDADLYLRKAASSHRFKEIAHSYKYIHIASHAEFLADAPLNSRLLLAPDGTDSGDLKVNDLYDLRLNARLVVLSACQTALSDISPGDEMIGIQRGFLYSGASAMIGSLWNISDEATQSVMVDFYGLLKLGESPALALQKAQLAGMEKFKSPYFWAPFQYTGLVDNN